ncbi:MAG: acylphosphatase [Spirochaetia bacterium]|jgi:acylphosphatase
MAENKAAYGGQRAFRALVIGRVQGVGFRYSAIHEARRLGINGTVSNQPDGSVEVVAEGEADRLARLASWLRKGPPGAHVRDLQIQWIPFTGRYTDFEVEF